MTPKVRPCSGHFSLSLAELGGTRSLTRPLGPRRSDFPVAPRALGTAWRANRPVHRGGERRAKPAIDVPRPPDQTGKTNQTTMVPWFGGLLGPPEFCGKNRPIRCVWNRLRTSTGRATSTAAWRQGTMGWVRLGLSYQGSVDDAG